MESREKLIMDLSNSCTEKDGMKLYKLKVSEVVRDDVNMLRVVNFGTENKEPLQSVLLLGETGSGKTQLINSFVNYLFNVELNDYFRIYLEDFITKSKSHIQSQTEYVTSYRIYHQPGMRLNKNFAFIDTPGLSCNKENADNDFIRRLHTFFSEEQYIDSLQAIGLVCKATQNRNEMQYKSITNVIASKFGQDCHNITHVLCTFANDKAPDSEVIRHSGLQFNMEYMFESSLLFSSDHLHNNVNSTKRQDIQWKWETMQSYIQSFLEDVSSVLPLRGKLIRELHEKGISTDDFISQLQNSVEKLRSVLNAEHLYPMDIKTIMITEKIRMLVTEKLTLVIHTHYCRHCNKTCGPLCYDPTYLKELLNFVSKISNLYFGPIIKMIINTIIDLTKTKHIQPCPLNSPKECAIDGCNHKMCDHEKRTAMGLNTLQNYRSQL